MYRILGKEQNGCRVWVASTCFCVCDTHCNKMINSPHKSLLQLPNILRLSYLIMCASCPGGPLVLALTDTTLSPLSASDGQPLVQSGSKTNADLLGGNPQLASARQALLKMGIRGTPQTNIVGTFGWCIAIQDTCNKGPQFMEQQ